MSANIFSGQSILAAATAASREYEQTQANRASDTTSKRGAAPLVLQSGTGRVHYARCSKLGNAVTIPVEDAPDVALATARKASCCKPVAADAVIGAAAIRDNDQRHAVTLARLAAESAKLDAAARRERYAAELVEPTPTLTGFAPGDVLRIVKSTYRWTVVESTDELVSVTRTRKDGTTQTRTVPVVNAERI